MFTLGLVVALLILALGIVGGTYLQFKTGWPWK